MPLRMSFNMTTEQARNRTKTVTRRKGWASLRPGDIVQQVEKAQGLKKGGKMFNISDSELKSFIDGVLDHRLYNCIIVDDSEENDDAVI